MRFGRTAISVDANCLCTEWTMEVTWLSSHFPLTVVYTILGERSSVPTKEGWSVGCTALPPAGFAIWTYQIPLHIIFILNTRHLFNLLKTLDVLSCFSLDEQCRQARTTYHGEFKVDTFIQCNDGPAVRQTFNFGYLPIMLMVVTPSLLYFLSHFFRKNFSRWILELEWAADSLVE